MNKLSKLTALLLALIMMLSAPLTAWAESIDTETKYEAQVSEILEKLYNTLMASTTYEEVLEATRNMTRTEIVAFLGRLLADTTVTDFTDYDEYLWQLYEEYMERNTYHMPVTFTNAGPLVDFGKTSTFSLLSRAASETATGSGITLTKSATMNSDGSGTITIEAYSTGSSIDQIISGTPVDVILVLDTSGSMGSLTGNKGGSVPLYSYSATTSINNSTTYYVCTNPTETNKIYVPVTRCATCEAWTTGCYHMNADGTYPSDYYSQEIIGQVYDPDVTTFYNRTQTSTQSKLAALKSAVTSFVSQFAAASTGLDNRLAFVTFDGSARIVKGTTRGVEASNAFINMKTDSATATTTANSDTALWTTGTGTQIHAGTEDALDILREYYNTDGVVDADKLNARERVVIIFTDGTPSYSGSGASTDVQREIATSAISFANTIKNTYDATVYTIGVVQGADGRVPFTSFSETGFNINQFLHFLSSNFPNSTNYTSWTSPDYPTPASYYLSAADVNTLQSIFNTIASRIEASIKASTTLGSTSSIRDVLTPQFSLPAGVDASNIGEHVEVYTSNISDVEYSVSTDNKVTITSCTFDDSNKTDYDGTVSIDSSSGAVVVSGFDFTEEWCGPVLDENKQEESLHGRKLIVKIPFRAKPGFLGGNNVLTNDTAGVFDSNGVLAQGVNSPTVNVPVLTPAVNVENKNIYLTNTLTQADLLSDASIVIPDCYGKTVEFDLGATNYGLEEWQTKYVDLSVVLPEVSENALTEDTDFSLSCTLTPKGTTGTAVTDTATINVFKPVLTLQDSKIEFNSEANLDNNAYYEAQNHVVSSDTWMHGTTVATSDIMYSGSVEPSLTLAYAPDKEWVSNGRVSATTDVNVNVAVKIGDTDYTAHATTIRPACTCTEVTCGHTAQSKDLATTHNPEFVIHIYNIEGELAITKLVSGSVNNDSFSFTVSLTLPANTTLTGPYAYTVKDANGNTVANAGGSISGTSGTITLSGGQTATITGLPAKTEYSVTETPVAGYTTTVAEGSEEPTSSLTKTGTIDGNGLDTVTFTNTYNPGTLTITKNVTKAEGVTLPEGTVFTFTVTLNPAVTGNFEYTVNGSNDKYIAKFTDGVATITLADGQMATFATLPDGVNYTVEETSIPDGYVLDTKTGDSGKISTNANAVFTNIHQYGNLVISKVVEGTDAPTGDAFTFTVTLSDTSISGTYGAATFTNGVATLTLTDGQTATITGIPADTTYTVTEAAVPGYTTSAEGDSVNGSVVTGTIDAAGIDTVAYTNEYKVGGLTVTKNVTGHTAPNDGKGNFTDVFTFTLALTSNNAPVLAKGVTCTIAGQATNVTWTDGKYTFELTDGQIATFANLPDGVTYTLIEVVDNVSKHYTSMPTNATGIIKAGETLEAEFDNDYKYGELTISKDVVNAPEGDTNRAFQFTVTLDQTAGVKYITSNDSTEKNFTGSIALKNGESVTFKYIPDGAAYTVKETLVAGYATTVTGGDISNDLTVSGAIENGVKDTIAFTNTYSVGNLSITKNVVGDTAPADTTFSFVVYFTPIENIPLAASYNYVITQVVNGTTAQKSSGTVANGGSITLQNGQTATISGIQAGVGYAVTETQEIGFPYTVTQTGNTGTIAANATQAAVFTNTYTKGDLKITKTVNGNGADLQKEFTFTVTIGASGTFNVVDENGNPKDSIASGGTIQLKNGETAIIKDIPNDTVCTVEETPVAGYAPMVEGKAGLRGSATIEQGTTVTIPFTNTYSVADLTITKVVTPADSKYVSPDDEFTITVTLIAGENAVLAKTYSITGLDDNKCAYDSDTGIVTLTMKKGQSAIIKGLQIGTGYEVVEANKPDYYKVSYNNKEGTISTTNAVTVTNEYQYGGLMITKKVDAAEGVTVPSQDFTFTVTLAGLTDPSFEATVEGLSTSTLTFTNGVATFPLQAGETATFLNLPVGVKYTVAEAVNNDYTTTATINGESVALTTANNLHQMETAGSIVENTSQNVVFTNTYQYSDLKISKTVVNASTLYPDDDLTAVPFTFTVTLNSEGSYTYVVTDTATGEAIKDESGSAITGSIANNGTLTLASGQTAIIRNIPVGTGYTVSEKAVPEFVTTVVGNTSGTISATEVPEVAFTNTYSVGQLKISKTVVDNSGMGYDLSNDVFTFTVSFSDTVNEYTYTKLDDTTGTITGTGTITLKHGETATFDRIPAGVTYTVTEINMPTGYTLTSSTTPADATIEANATDAVTFTNTYNTGSLTISKNGMASGEVAVFTAEVCVRGQKQTLTVVVPNGSSTTINGLDLGSTYTVREIGDWTWRYTSKVTSGNSNGKIPDTSNYNAAVTFANTKDNPYWLDGSAYADNAFGDTTPDNP